jgi:hypothetical protein
MLGRSSLTSALRGQLWPAARRYARAGGMLGIAVCVALVLVEQPTYGADPLSRMDGTYAGTLEWPWGQPSERPSSGLGLIEPVYHFATAKLSVSVLRGNGAVGLRWTYGDESLDGWIDGTIGTHTYHAPAGVELLCRPVPAYARPSASLWLACEPPGAPGTAPRVLMTLAAIDEAQIGTAKWVSLRIKHFEDKHRVLWEDADVQLRRQTE